MTAQNCPLTDKEQNIVQLLANGKGPKQIAHDMGVVENTVNKHIFTAKIGAGIRGKSVAHLVAVSIRNGWVQ